MARSPRIAVIGAGLGGGAAASLLQQKGYDVAVYEQAPAFSRLGAGIHVGPNMLKVLIKLGIGQQMLDNGVQPVSWISRAWDSNELLFELPLRDVSQEKYGAPYITIHRGDMHKLIIDSLDPATVHFGKKLVDMRDDGNVVRLKFEDGTEAKADFVVGADGLNSKVREILLGQEAPTYTGVVGHRVLYPASLIKGAPIPDFTKWWHPDKHVIVYYVTNRRDEVYIVTGAPQPLWESSSNWMPCSKDEFLGCFEGFHEEAQRILRVAPPDGITKWAFFGRNPLPCWSVGRVVMLGDACHPMKPHMGQGGAMAVEDAAMLFRCIEETGIANYRDAFELYEANRHARAERVQRTSYSNTWLREPTDPTWVFAYDVFSEPLVAPNKAA